MFNVTPLAAQELHAALLRSDAAGMALRIAARADDDGSVQIGMGIDEAREEDATLQFGELTVLLGAPSRPLLDEAVLGRPLDKSAFRRRLKVYKDLVEVPGEFVRGVQRPAQLYRAREGFRF